MLVAPGSTRAPKVEAVRWAHTRSFELALLEAGARFYNREMYR